MAEGEKLLIYVLKANGIRRVHSGGERFVVCFPFAATIFSFKLNCEQNLNA